MEEFAFCHDKMGGRGVLKISLNLLAAYKLLTKAMGLWFFHKQKVYISKFSRGLRI
jgi:hypothetical protein